MDNELKLYVWEDVLCDYKCGIMVALAHNVEQARQLLVATGKIEEDDKDLAKEPVVVTAPQGFVVWGSE